MKKKSTKIKIEFSLFITLLILYGCSNVPALDSNIGAYQHSSNIHVSKKMGLFKCDVSLVEVNNVTNPNDIYKLNQCWIENRWKYTNYWGEKKIDSVYQIVITFSDIVYNNNIKISSNLSNSPKIHSKSVIIELDSLEIKDTIMLSINQVNYSFYPQCNY